MSTDLTVFDPIKPPAPRRPATLPSLPEWLARSTAAARPELQIDQTTGRFVEVLVLPAPMLPSPEQRTAMREHIDSLRSYLRQTPAESVEAENAVATAVSKLIVVLAGERKSELSEGARADVYLDVLDDVPCWAVEAAVRAWFKHDAGTDERGKAHNYVFAPDPGTLRKIALRETHGMSARIGKVQRVLDAREYFDCSAQLADGRAAMRGLHLSMGNPDAMQALTFADAVKLGHEAANAPAPSLQKMPTDPPAHPPQHEAAE